MDRAWQWANSVRHVADIGLKKILLFGGTFDPVHLGHIAMAASALTETDTAHLTILPAGNPWQRARLPFATAEDRMAMLQRAFAGIAGASIDARELERPGATYTVDTLRELREVHGDDASLIWLIGGDAFARLDSWHQWQSLFSLGNFAVALRQGEPHPLHALSPALKLHLASRQTGANALGDSPFGKFAMLQAQVPPISSTDIRTRLKNLQSIRGFTPDAVCDYIEQHRLYEPLENL